MVQTKCQEFRHSASNFAHLNRSNIETFQMVPTITVDEDNSANESNQTVEEIANQNHHGLDEGRINDKLTSPKDAIKTEIFSKFLINLILC